MPAASLYVRKCRDTRFGRPGPGSLIDYTVRIADVHRHLFEVDCRIDAAAAEEVFEFASWIPGSYLLREYARHVVRAQAIGPQGEPLVLEKIAHNAWRCTSDAGVVTLRLHVYALDASVRGAWLDARRGYFNGTCLFARPRGRPDDNVRLRIEAPLQESFNRWRVASAMRPVAADARGFGTYEAADYDELLDHPFEIGEFDRVDFHVLGIPHSLVVAGNHDGDLERVAADLQTLCSAQIQFFGAPAPFDRYVFLCLATSGGYGGLEHRCSSSLMFHRDELPRHGEQSVGARYQRMLSLASHEYFHAWHVKRTRPAAFMPYRLGERNHTRLLWVFEGITSYYQDRFLLSSGLIERDDYLRRLADIVSNVWRVPGRFVQSLEDSSFDAWDKLYKPDANSSNAGVSYYSKGALVALALDLEIRLRHDSRISLDTVVRSLWREFGAQEVGLAEDGFETLAKSIAGDDLAEFFDNAVRGTQDPPLQELLASFGIAMQLCAGGGAPSRDAGDDAQRVARPWLGISPKRAADGVECAAVLDGGPAQCAGINPGDVIVALDRRRATLENLDDLLGRYRGGDRASASVFRDDELLDFEVTLEDAPGQVCRLEPLQSAGAAEISRRRDWLHG